VVGTAIHDSQIYDDCMQANGWLVADGQAANPIPVQTASLVPGAPAQSPVYATPLPPPLPPVESERARRAREADEAAEAWVAAQAVLNSGPAKERLELNAVLCNAGDRSACVIALALVPSKR
jgi:hypothetical protein